jgi:hypothetical protein
MISIVGNIKLDESKPERIKYLLACIKSYDFIGHISHFALNLDSPSPHLFGVVNETLRASGHRFILTASKPGSYGETYSYLLRADPTSRFVINFMEDHFMVIDDADKFEGLLNTMTRTGADICASTFFPCEQKSAAGLREYFKTPLGLVYENSMENYTDFQKHYGSRYYIGVNFVTTRKFAERFWNRDCGHRPHEYEISFYDKEWLHTMMIPGFEIMASVDDPHGEEGSNLLARNEPKWKKIFEEVSALHAFKNETQVIKSK